MVSKSFEGQTDRTEEWYGTQYKQEAISDEVIKVRGSLKVNAANTHTNAQEFSAREYVFDAVSSSESLRRSEFVPLQPSGWHAPHNVLRVAEMGECRLQRSVQAAREE